MGFLGDIVGGVGNIVGGKKGKDRARSNINEYRETMQGLGPMAEYQGPGAIERVTGATVDPATMQAAQRGAAAQAGLAQGAQGAQFAQGAFGDYSPADTRGAAYASMQQQAADAINMAGGRQQNQARAAERAAVGMAPGIENQYAQSLQQLAMAKGAMAGQAGLGNVGAQNQAAQYQAGLDQQANVQNMQAQQQANMFGGQTAQQAAMANAAAQNQSQQTQADRAYTSDQNRYMQGLANAQQMFQNQTGTNTALAAGGQQMIGGFTGLAEGIGGAAKAAAGAF